MPVPTGVQEQINRATHFRLFSALLSHGMMATVALSWIFLLEGPLQLLVYIRAEPPPLLEHPRHIVENPRLQLFDQIDDASNGCLDYWGLPAPGGSRTCGIANSECSIAQSQRQHLSERLLLPAKAFAMLSIPPRAWMLSSWSIQKKIARPARLVGGLLFAEPVTTPKLGVVA